MRCGIRPGVKIPRTHIKGRAQFVIPAFRWPSQGSSLWCKLAPYTTEPLVGRRSNINLWPLHADAYLCVPTQMQRHTCTHRLETNNILQVPVIVMKRPSITLRLLMAMSVWVGGFTCSGGQCVGTCSHLRIWVPGFGLRLLLFLLASAFTWWAN